MIQRIQSLFLLVACIAFFLIIFHPIARMNLSNGGTLYLTSIGVKINKAPSDMVYNAFPIGILACICGIMCFITIVLYHKRQLQMRFCVYNLLLTLAIAILIFAYYYFIQNKTIDNNIKVLTSALLYPVVLPFVNIILLFQSFRAIRRDDLLIKSYDRLR